MAEELIEDIIANSTSSETPDSPASEPSAPKEPSLEEEPLAKASLSEETSLSAKDTKSDVTVEDLAIQIGWNPNYKGEGAIDAATFILKSREIQDTMREHNETLKGQLAEVKASVQALKVHNDRVYKTELKQKEEEIAALKKERRAAIEVADVETVDQLDAKIDDLQKDLAETPPEKAASANPIFDAWVKDNQWYLTNPEMAGYAETVAAQYQGAPVDRIYKLVRQKVAEVFPENFAPQDKKAKPIGPASPVEPPRPGGTKTTFTKANLTPDQRSIMTQFVKQGIMTEEQYIKDIAKLQEA